MSGNLAIGHRAASKRRPQLIPAIIGVAVAVVLVGGAVAALNLGPGGSKPVAVSAPIAAGGDRSGEPRADRGELRDAPSQTPTPTPAPTLSPTVGPPSQSASPSHSPSKKTTKSPTTGPTSGTASSGTCGVSFYDTGSHTANGEKFDPNGLTAAHKTLPFNTMVRVTNPANGKSVIVRINDRGPFVSNRCIDLAKGAFVQIASVSAGVIPHAKYEVLK